ncbi:unnamed protein product [Calypogeia fissa]
MDEVEQAIALTPFSNFRPDLSRPFFERKNSRLQNVQHRVQNSMDSIVNRVCGMLGLAVEVAQGRAKLKVYSRMGSGEKSGAFTRFWDARGSATSRATFSMFSQSWGPNGVYTWAVGSWAGQ